MKHGLDLGRLAFEVYCEARGWNEATEVCQPQWQDQDADVRNAWRLAAAAVLQEVQQNRAVEVGPEGSVEPQSQPDTHG